MTKQEFMILAKAMKAVYSLPTFLPDKEALDVWYSLLDDLPYKLASASLKRHMQTSSKIPTPADIRYGAVTLTEKKQMTEAEAWAQVSKAISRSAYYSEEEFEKLPEAIQKAVGDEGQLFIWSQTSVDEVETVIHSQFLRAYRAVMERKKHNAQLSPDLLALIDERKKLTDENVDNTSDIADMRYNTNYVL